MSQSPSTCWGRFLDFVHGFSARKRRRGRSWAGGRNTREAAARSEGPRADRTDDFPDDPIEAGLAAGFVTQPFRRRAAHEEAEEGAQVARHGPSEVALSKSRARRPAEVL